MRSKRIKHDSTVPYTPEQNERLEWDNQTIVESAGTMLRPKSLPKFLWAEAIHTAVYSMTLTSRNLSKSPYEIWTGNKPSIKHLRVFGSAAVEQIPKLHRIKLDATEKSVIFVGYQCDSTNYRMYNPATRKISTSRNVTFLEKENVSVPDQTNAIFLFVLIRRNRKRHLKSMRARTRATSGRMRTMAPLRLMSRSSEKSLTNRSLLRTVKGLP